MKRTLRTAFLVIEINCILWLAVFGLSSDSLESMESVHNTAIAGLAFAVVAQHWAYYAVYKKAKQMT